MLERLGFPKVGEHRRFVGAIVTDTIGSGLFMPITLLYFLAVSPLSLVQIGAALSLSALVALPSTVLIGSAVDRFGPRRIMLLGNLVQLVGMAAYLVTESFWTLALWSAVLNVGRQCFWGSFGNVVTAITSPGERELWFGFLQAMRNLGYAVGGILAGAAVQIGTDAVYRGVVVANALSFLLAWWLLLAVPDHHGPRSSEPGSAGPDAAAAPSVGGWLDVLRDGPYRSLVITQIGFVAGTMVLNYALPVYIATTIDLPGWVVGAVFTLNTIMVGLGQGLAVRAMTGQVRSRMLALANLVFAAAYLIFVLCGLLPVWAGVVLMLGAGALYTCGELTGSPVVSATAAEAAPDHLRGRYLSLFQLSWAVGGILAPVAYTGLLARGPYVLWWTLVVVAATTVPFCLRLRRRLPAAAQRVTRRAEPVSTP